MPRSCRRHMSFMSRCSRKNPIHPLKVSKPFSIGREEPMPARPTRRSSSTPKLSKNWIVRALSTDCTRDRDSGENWVSRHRCVASFLFWANCPLIVSPLAKLIMRHIFLTGDGNHEVLFCLRDRLWPQFFGTKHCGHSSDDRARAWNFAGGVVAPDMRKTELAQSQR